MLTHVWEGTMIEAPGLTSEMKKKEHLQYFGSLKSFLPFDSSVSFFGLSKTEDVPPD
jgi:hypothetical protein